jgi:TIR domain
METQDESSSRARPAAGKARHWFLSFHSLDHALAERLKGAIERKDSASRVFFAPTHMRAGGSWSAQLAQEIADATAFVLLIGKEVGPWQVLEYDEALDKWAKSPSGFPLIVILLEGQTAPGLPFLRRLHWIITPDPSSEKDVGRLFDAAAGSGSSRSDLWRYTSPYRGLAAMEEKDSDYFFGRKRETVDVLSALADAPDRLPLLIGNSGVGKSSLAQAGVLAALKRQAWPEEASQTSNRWPAAFHDSRQWCFLSLKPGTDPLKALVESFFDTWQFAATDPERVTRHHGWMEALHGGKATLPDLIDATERRRKELDQPKPQGFFLYVDQGEELYVRAEEGQRRRFSELLARALPDPRLHIMMSMRLDFLGHLQNDKPLFKVRQQIDVPPLGEEELRKIVSRPAHLLSARFETDGLVDIISRRTAEDAVKDVGALPLLSYTLDDMWAQMVRRDDGTLRLAAQSFELGGVLVDRANRFLETHPGSEDALRRVLTLRLATVREDGEPTRRRAARAEFSDQEWRLVSELANYPNRLLATVTTEAGEIFAEVAREAIFRRWVMLREWIAAEREFLAWRGHLETDRRRWEGASDVSRTDALLMGLSLAQAQAWLSKRAEDLARSDREFIYQSIERQNAEQVRAEKIHRRFTKATVVSILLNVLSVTIISMLIWRGTAVLEKAWDDVRRVRESDRLLVQLSNETSRLQILIHRHIVAPNDQVLAEVLGLHGGVLSTLRNRGAVDPVLSGSANELRALTERFLLGFGEVRALQTAISQTYENEVLKPAKDVIGLYSIIESSIESRDSLLLPSLAKSRDSFTDGLLAANAFYLAPASQAGDEARASIATVEQTIPVMLDLADSGLQRDAISALAQAAGAFREGLKNLTEHFAARAHLLQTAIDDNQASMIALINKLSAQMGLREMRAQGSFERTLADLYLNVALMVILVFTITICAGAYGAKSLKLTRPDKPMLQIRSTSSLPSSRN